MDAGPWMTGNFPGERVARAPVELPPSPAVSVIVPASRPVQKFSADVVHRSRPLRLHFGRHSALSRWQRRLEHELTDAQNQIDVLFY